jgi:cullin-associated NEDD8-dissociated protein 1
MPILGSFLRKNQRALKLCTLTLLDVLVRGYNNVMAPELLSTVSSKIDVR